MMEKQDIIHSLNELKSEDEIEILSQSKNSICLYDYQAGKEIVYTFKRSKTELASHVHISRKIPKKYRPNREKLVQYILNLPSDMLLTLSDIWFVWGEDDYDDMVSYYDADPAYACDLYDENCLGKMWFEKNAAIVDVQNIFNSALEIEKQDIAMGFEGNAYQDTLEQIVITAIHEIRHIMMDTNIILPEDEYPISLASEFEVEEFAREWVREYGWNVF